MLVLNLTLFFASFFVIWFGTGLIIDSLDTFSKKLKVSSFSLSFIVLGMLTSIPEMAVGMTAVAENQPEIFVGNLLGGSIVIFLLVIPLLAIFGKEIRLAHQLNKKQLLVTLLVIATPSILITDKKVTNPEAILLIVMYLILLVIVQKHRGLLDRIQNKFGDDKRISFKEPVKIILGIVLVFLSSQFIVDKTLYFSHVFNISTFLVSLILVSVGTNIPELSIAIRSVLRKKKEVAFGDYIGSASINTLLFGIFSFISNGNVITSSRFFITFLFTCLGLSIFYYFSRSRNNISRGEGLVLFGFYILFILVETLK